MKTLINIRETAGALWERHSFIGKMMDIAGITNGWSSLETRPSAVHLIHNEDSPFQFGKNGTIVALIAPEHTQFCNDFQAALTKQDAYAVQQVFDDLSEKIADSAEYPDSAIEDNIDTIVDITYKGKKVMSNIVIDKQLQFNLVAIDFKGGTLDESELVVTYRNREGNTAKYQSVITVSEPNLNELERLALLQSPALETGVKLDFSPRAKFLDDIVHDVGDAGKDAIDAAAGAAGAAYGAAKVAAKDVGGGVADAAEGIGVDDAVATAIGEGVADATVAAAAAGGPELQEAMKNIDFEMLRNMDSEASVDELISLRNNLLTLSKLNKSK